MLKESHSLWCLVQRRKKFFKASSDSEAMGSTAVLTSHLQLNNTRYLFKCLNSSIRNQPPSPQFNRRKAKFGVSHRRERNKFIGVACFSADDDLSKQKQQEQLAGGGGVGSAVEDRPGTKKKKKNSPSFVHTFISHLN